MLFNLHRSRRGTTLVEMMIVVTIFGILISVAPGLYKQVRRFFFLNNARVTLQRNGRAALELITKRVRSAVSTSLVMDQAAGQPIYSRITFNDVNGNRISYYQNGKSLMMTVNNSTSTLVSDLRYLAFALPRSDDMGIVSVSLTLEESIYQGQTKALHMASEKVQVMN